MDDEQNQTQDPRDYPERRFEDKATATELTERIRALSWQGQHMVCQALMQARPDMVVATACDALTVSGVLESMAGYCDRVRETSTYLGKTEEADVYQWRESLLRAFQRAMDGPPHQG